MTPDMYIAAFNSAAQNLRDFVVLFGERGAKRRARKDANREERWDGVIEAATDLEALVIHHRELIKTAIAPIIETGDLAGSTYLIDQLVNNDNLPDSYGHLKGAIRQYAQMSGFTEPAKCLMTNLLGRVRLFQFAAFLIPGDYKFEDDHASDALGKGALPSGNKLQAIYGAGKVFELLGKADKTAKDQNDIWGYSSYVLKELAGVPQEQYDPTVRLGFETQDDVVGTVKLFCEQWLQNVRAQINIGRGVHSWVASLVAESHNKK
jgi:hypothetical protein